MIIPFLSTLIFPSLLVYTQYGRASLFWASVNGSPEIVQALVAAGADVNTRTLNVGSFKGEGIIARILPSVVIWTPLPHP